MIFLKHQPTYPLSEFIDFFWYYDGFEPQHSKEKLIPNGDIELVINLEECPKRLFDKDDFNKFEYKKRYWISGIQREYIVIEATPNSTMMGIHFKPGGAHPFFKFPITEIQDKVIELDEIWGRSIDFIWEQLMMASTPQQKFCILEQHFLKQLDGIEGQNSIIIHALKLLQDTANELPVRSIAEEVGISHKHLIRTFDKIVGIKPKLLSRIYKFQKAIHLIGNKKRLRWTSLAYECGYYDQAHFIKEFKNFSGINPSSYLDQHGEYLNYIPLDPF